MHSRRPGKRQAVAKAVGKRRNPGATLTSSRLRLRNKRRNPGATLTSCLRLRNKRRNPGATLTSCLRLRNKRPRNDPPAATVKNAGRMCFPTEAVSRGKGGVATIKEEESA